MKHPNVAQGALTFAFTVAGTCIGFACRSETALCITAAFVAAIGGMAAALAGDSK